MSDSDSTWPATDDFGSRFLEIDEFITQPCDDDQPPNKDHSPSRDTSSKKAKKHSRSSSLTERSRSGKSSRRHMLRTSREETFDTDLNPTRSKRKSTKKRLHDHFYGDEDEAEPHSDEEDETPFRTPKLYTARQISLHIKRTSGNRVSSSEGLMSLDDLKPTPTLTPEQIAARQRSIARRRESAKNKVELQKKQTVERLLKVNTTSRRSGKGRMARFMRSLHHSASTTSFISSASNGTPENESPVPEQDNDTIVLRRGKNASSSLSLPDPPANYIRLITSTRLSPSNRVCFPPDYVTSLFIVSNQPVCREPQYCSQGCGRLKRYSSSTTGLPLCSLSCYKASLARVNPSAEVI